MNKNIFRVHIKTINNDIIISDNKKYKKTHFDLYYYNPKFNSNLNIYNLLNILLKENLIELISEIIFKKHNFKFLIDKNIDNLVYSIDFKILNFSIQSEFSSNIINNNILFDKISPKKFHKIFFSKNKDTKNIYDTLEQLLKYYKYPLRYNKNLFSFTFHKILYILYIYNNLFFDNKKINNYFISKIKGLFIFIINFYYSYINNKINILNDIKFYSNNLYFIIIYIHFFKNDDILERDKRFYLFREKFILNFKFFQIIKNLEWINIKYKINYLQFLFDNKNNIQQFLLNYKKSFKLNEKIFELINNPFYMFNYLYTKKDFIKWINLFKYNLNTIFLNTIKVKNINDYGKILFYISQIKNQDLEDKKYCKILVILTSYSKKIYYNNNLNINIKKIFLKNNLNVNILDEHLKLYENNNIKLYYSDDEIDGIFYQIN